MARELIAATGPSSFTQGELNYIAGGVMGGGPVQDIFDLQAANTAEHLSGHFPFELPAVPQRPRPPGFAEPVGLLHHPPAGLGHGFLHVAGPSTTQTGQGAQPWSLVRTTAMVDYQLNTTTGNRPARCTVNSSGACVTPHHDRPADLHFRRIAPLGRPGLPGVSGPEDHLRFPVRARDGQLHLGVLLRPGHREPVEPVRSDALGSRQSSLGLPLVEQPLHAAAFQSPPAERPGAGFHQQRIQPESADARDRQFARLSAFFALQRNLGPELADAVRASPGPAAVVGRAGRRRSPRAPASRRPTPMRTGIQPP